jgi:hypothetical protein
MWQLKDNAKRNISIASLMTKDQRSCQFNPLLPQLEIIENAKRKEEPTAPRLVNPGGFFLALNPSIERNAQAESGVGARSCQ